MRWLFTAGAAPSSNAQSAGEKCRCVAFRLDAIRKEECEMVTVDELSRGTLIPTQEAALN